MNGPPLRDTSPRSPHPPAKRAPLDSYRPDSDRDPQETQEWVESLESVAHHTGRERAGFLVARVIEASRRLGVDPAVVSAPMITTIVDGTGLIIYFEVAKLLIPALGA